jgi:hypothetical protein
MKCARKTGVSFVSPSDSGWPKMIAARELVFTPFTRSVSPYDTSSVIAPER